MTCFSFLTGTENWDNHTYSDVSCTYPLQKLVDFHRKHGKEGTIVVGTIGAIKLRWQQLRIHRSMESLLLMRVYFFVFYFISRAWLIVLLRSRRSTSEIISMQVSTSSTHRWSREFRCESWVEVMYRTGQPPSSEKYSQLWLKRSSSTIWCWKTSGWILASLRITSLERVCIWSTFTNRRNRWMRVRLFQVLESSGMFLW